MATAVVLVASLFMVLDDAPDDAPPAPSTRSPAATPAPQSGPRSPAPAGTGERAPPERTAPTTHAAAAPAPTGPAPTTGAEAPDPAGPVSVEVRVRGPFGRPVAGARLSCTPMVLIGDDWYARGTAHALPGPLFTDDHGRHTFSLPSPGRYEITAFQSGYTFEEVVCDTSDGPPRPVLLELDFSAPIGPRVLDDEERPLRAHVEARITARWSRWTPTETARGVTDGRGRLLLAPVPDGSTSLDLEVITPGGPVRVLAPDWPRRRDGETVLHLSLEDLAPDPARRGTVVHLVARRGTRIALVAPDAAFNQGVPEGEAADDLGRVLLRGVPPGEHLLVRHQGSEVETRPLHVPDAPYVVFFED